MSDNKLIQLATIAILLSSFISIGALSSQNPKHSKFTPAATYAFTTSSGLPVCSYALGGAARSSQPSSLPYSYYEHLQRINQTRKKLNTNNASSEVVASAPFYFYYNPHRYPAFMNGLLNDICDSSSIERKNVFIASGGTDRSISSMDQRLEDALIYSGGDYLDMFVLEYVCPYELSKPSAIEEAIQHAQSWVQQGKVRYVAASTHSHVVGAKLAAYEGINALMLRYNMAHRDAAENLSFPACIQYRKPVIAFTTTRWNALQNNHAHWKKEAPTTGDCLSFAVSNWNEKASPPVEIVLHSARNEAELEEALRGLRDIPAEEVSKWRKYGDLDWNDDGFDEYPEERKNN